MIFTNKEDKIDAIVLEHRQYDFVNGCRCFLEENRRGSNSTGTGFLAYVQAKFKRFGALYYWLISVFGPVLPSRYYKKQISKHFKIFTPGNSIIVNIGSGPQYFSGRKDVINIDLFPFDEVDIVADATDLPIKSNSVDFVINVAMLEHVRDPEEIVGEMERILKPGGRVLAYVPFIVPYHAAPFDFQRWTQKGAVNLFHSFHFVVAGIGCGPTSGLLYVFQSWLALVLSCGNKTAYDCFFMIAMFLLFPIKLLDILLEEIPFSAILASGFLVTGKKTDHIT